MGANLAKEKIPEGLIGAMLKIQTKEVDWLLISQLCINQGLDGANLAKVPHQKVNGCQSVKIVIA